MRRALSVLLVLGAVIAPFPELSAAAGPEGQFRQRASVSREMTASDVTEEVRFGREVAARVIGRFGLSEDPAVTRYVNLVGRVIALHTNRPELEFRFAVLNTDAVNAFATPGGYIFVTRGALGQMRDEAELAGVLAHELGHVVERHAVRELNIRGVDVSVESGFATFLGGGSQTTRTAFAQAVERVLDMLFKDGYKRADEAQADNDAVQFMALAGYDPAALTGYFERLNAVKGRQTEVLDRTHPPYEDRIAWLGKAIAWEGMDAGNYRRNEKRFAEVMQQGR